MSARLNLLMLFALATLVVGCGDDDDATTTTGAETTTAAADEATLPDPIPVDDAKRVQLKDRLLTEISIPEGPDWMVSAFGSLWVKQDSGGVVRIDPDTGKTVAEISPGSSGGHLCQGIGATDDAIWSCPRDGVVERIDPAKNEVAETVRIDKLPEQGRLVGAADLLWLLTDSGERLTAIDSSTGKPSGTVDLGGRCGDLAGADDTVWVMCPVDGRVVRVDAQAAKVEDELALAGAANASVGDDLWVSFEGGIAQIDPETLDVLAVYEASARFGGSILATPEAVWVRQDGGPFLTRIDPERQTIVETIEAPDLASGGDVVQIEDSVWATAFDDATLVELQAAAP